MFKPLITFRFFTKLLALTVLFFTLTCAYSKEKYVILITIDGLRPDAITLQTTPNLTALLKKSSYSLNAKTVYPSSTMPSHTSLFTGLDAVNHKNTLNDYRVINKLIAEGKYLQIDSIFSLGLQKGMKSTFICGKDKLRFLIKPDAKNHIFCIDVYGTKNSIVPEITGNFTASFKKYRNRINFIHYPQPDMSGHRYGWMSDEYIESLTMVDAEFKKLISFINSNLSQNNYLVIITSDHGGKGYTHGTRLKEHITIPWIAYGKSVKKDYKIQKHIRIYDTAPTILHFLDIELPAGLDGQVVKEIFN